MNSSIRGRKAFNNYINKIVFYIDGTAHRNASAFAWTGMLVFTLQEKENTKYPLQSLAIKATAASYEPTATSQLILIASFTGFTQWMLVVGGGVIYWIFGHSLPMLLDFSLNNSYQLFFPWFDPLMHCSIPQLPHKFYHQGCIKGELPLLDFLWV